MAGISNPNGYSNLRWRREAPNITIINTFNATEPWAQHDISENGSFVNPNDIKLPVELTSFKAATEEDVVTLTWNSFEDKGLAGFNIYRKAEKSSEYQKVNESIIKETSGDEYNYNDHILQADINYLYKLEAIDINGSRIEYGPIEIFVDKITPKSFLLDQNYPNPFNPTTTISYHIPKQCNVEIVIYNSIGQELKHLVKKNVSPGSYVTEWDGKDASGQLMGSGLYIVRMRAGDFVQSRKILLIR